MYLLNQKRRLHALNSLTSLLNSNRHFPFDAIFALIQNVVISTPGPACHIFSIPSLQIPRLKTYSYNIYLTLHPKDYSGI